MAFQAEGPHVGEVALTAALTDRNDVIGIPQAFTGVRLDTPFPQGNSSTLGWQTPQPAPLLYAIYAADAANPLVTLQDLVAQVTRVAAEFPFVNAIGRTERAAPSGWNLKVAPATPVPTILSLG